MARKQPVGYEVARPLTLWGRKRNIGDSLSLDEVASLIRIESLVRSGRIRAIYDETDRGQVVRGNRGKVVEKRQPTARRWAKHKEKQPVEAKEEQ